MALSSSVFLTSSCVPQTQTSRPLSVTKPLSSVPQTTSLMLPKASQKFQYQQPLKSNRRSFGTVVKAIKKEDKSFKNVEIFSEEHLLESLAHDIFELSQKVIKDKGSFSVALSDTSSIRFLRKLAEAPYVNTIDWSKWKFFWVEEEVFVPGDQLKKRLEPNDQVIAKINHKLAYDEFLTMVSRTRGTLNVYTMDYDLSDQEEAAERYQKSLEIWVSKNEIAKSTKNQLPKFDLMVLGVEPNGRVASLLPDHSVLEEKEKWVASVEEKDKDATRVTFTLPVINSSSNIAMVVAGSANADAVYSALKDDDYPQAPPRKLPAKLISPDEGELVWYLDKAAASKLFKEEIHIDKRSQSLDN